MIIGIMGKAQHGKDTLGKMLADAIYEETKTRYILMAYATELKKRVQNDFDLTYEQLWGNEKEKYDYRYPRNRNNWIAGRRDTGKIKENYWTPREILQEYGQFFRTIDYDFWVKALFSVIKEKGFDNVIITDVRHPNEADPIKKKDGMVIRIVRNVETGVHNQKHISETALDNYEPDIEVRNMGSLKDLRKTADHVARIIVKGEKIKDFKNIKIGG